MKQFIKKEGKEKIQRARLRKIEIDPKKSSNFGLCAGASANKNVYNIFSV